MRVKPRKPRAHDAAGALGGEAGAETRAADSPIRVLILEDSPADAELMVNALRRAGFDPRWERVETEAEFASRLTPDLDLILSDYGLPKLNGLDALRLTRSRGLDVPFILVSGSIGEDIAVTAMREGADDYLLKDRMVRLGPAAGQALEKRRLRAEKERVESALLEAETRYRSIFEGVAEGIVLSTPEGRILAANPAFARMLGYGSPEELTSSVTDVAGQLYAEPSARRDLSERLRRDGEVRDYETRGVRRDGTPLWASLSSRLVRDERGGISHILTTVSDISERKRTEEARAHLAAIVENSDDAIIGRSLDGIITSWNAGAERLLGYSAAEAIGRTFAFLMPEGQPVRTQEFNEKLIRGEAIAPHETRRRAKDGQVIDVLSTTSPIRDQDGKVIGASQILRDISALKRAESAMKESEERSRAAFEQAGVGMALRGIDPRQSRWLRVNQKLCDILGYTRDELLQLTSVDITPPDDRDMAVDYNEKLLSGELTSYSREKRYVRKDGRIIWCNITLTAVTGPDGRRSHVISVIEDITARKEAEEKVRRLNRVYAMMSGVNSAIVRTRNKQQLYYEACHIAIEHGKFGMAWIGELDPEKLEVRPVASVGLEDSNFLMRTVLSVRPEPPHGQGVLPRAVRERRPVFSNDITVDPDVGGERRKEAIRRGYRSVIVLPLMVEGSVTGTFSVFAKELNYFDDEEVKLLAELAGNISFALEYMARQERIEKLSRVRAITSEINAAIVRVRERGALLKEICRIASELGKFELVWIGMVDHDRQEVRPVAWTGFSTETAHAVSWASINAAKGTLGEAMHTRKAALRDDIQTQLPAGKLRQEALDKGCLSTVCLPLVVDNKVTNLVVLFATGRGFFDRDELAVLDEAASNVSFALEAIARQERIERLSRVRSVLGEINAAIVRIRNRQELFDEACRVAVDHGGFGIAWIGQLDPQTLDITAVAHAGPEANEFLASVKSSARDDHPQGKGVAGRAIRQRTPVFENDLLAEQGPTGTRKQKAVRLGYQSRIALPLVTDSDVVGVWVLYAREKDFFTEEELKLLTELAGNISFALEHMARQEKIEKLSRIRAISSEINAAIVRIRNRQELFDEACRIAVEAGRFPFAWLGIVDRDVRQLRAVAWAGVESGFLDPLRKGRPLDETQPQDHGPARRAVLEKKVVVANDIRNDPQVPRKQEHLERNINSVAALPLLVSDEVVGVLALHATEVGFFDEEEIKMLSELAGDIAFALDHIEKAEKLEYLYYYDALTGLPNRSLFIDRTGQQMRTRGGEPLMVAVVLLNLERFRNVNESFGRHGGDELLKLVARRLEVAFNGKDYLARIGADGFGVVMRGIRDAAAVVHAAENQVLGCFREPYRLDEAELHVAAKAGIAMFPADGVDADTLFKNAEAALKRARESGERYLFYAADMNARAAHALSLETRLRKAVEARQFVLHYQPKISLPTDTVSGLEALIRWQDPDSGLVPPGTFIPLLEETGLILEVGKWALGQALADHRHWTARGCSVPRIAVNVSAIQLQQRDFTDTVVNIMQEEGNVGGALEIEITESLLMKDVEASIGKLSILRGLGIHVAMDDFGTGYSSLSYIARLPINSVKIDRSFINGVAGNAQDMAIVTTIIALAHSLNLLVVAEGVETGEQAQLLRLLKCDEAQGFLFSKPLPAAGIEPLLRTLASDALHSTVPTR